MAGQGSQRRLLIAGVPSSLVFPGCAEGSTPCNGVNRALGTGKVFPNQQIAPANGLTATGRAGDAVLGWAVAPAGLARALWCCCWAREPSAEPFLGSLLHGISYPSVSFPVKIQFVRLLGKVRDARCFRRAWSSAALLRVWLMVASFLCSPLPAHRGDVCGTGLGAPQVHGPRRCTEVRACPVLGVHQQDAPAADRAGRFDNSHHFEQNLENKNNLFLTSFP